MSTTPSPVSNVATAIGSVVGSTVGAAASGPMSIVQTFVGLGKDLIDRFIPDPAAKMAAQQHLADQSFQLQMAAFDQQNKIMEASSENQKSDPHASGSRAYFCYGITTMLLVNYGIAPFFAAVCHWAFTPFSIPPSILMIFATIMLGWVGIPSMADMVKSVMEMPGDSGINVLGMNVKQTSAPASK
jgi:hypothetical protein